MTRVFSSLLFSMIIFSCFSTIYQHKQRRARSKRFNLVQWPSETEEPSKSIADAASLIDKALASEDNTDKFETDFIKTRIYQGQGNVKRSEIEGTLNEFLNDNDGATIVIDSGQDMDTHNDINIADRGFKKTIRAPGAKLNETVDGYTIVLDDNGALESDTKKDDVYETIDDNFADMDQHFNELLHDRSSKRVQILLLTPKNLSSEQKTKSALSNSSTTTQDQDPRIEQRRIPDDSRSNMNENNSFFKLDPVIESGIKKLQHVKEQLNTLNEDVQRDSKAISNENDGVRRNFNADAAYNGSKGDDSVRSHVNLKSTINKNGQQVMPDNFHESDLSTSQLDKDQIALKEMLLPYTNHQERNDLAVEEALKNIKLLKDIELPGANFFTKSADERLDQVRPITSSTNVKTYNDWQIVYLDNETNSDLPSRSPLSTKGNQEPLGETITVVSDIDRNSSEGIAGTQHNNSEHINGELGVSIGRSLRDQSIAILHKKDNFTRNDVTDLGSIAVTKRPIVSNVSVHDVKTHAPLANEPLAQNRKIAGDKVDVATGESSSVHPKQGLSSGTVSSSRHRWLRFHDSPTSQVTTATSTTSHHAILTTPILPTSSPSSRVLDKDRARAILEYLDRDPLESWRYPFSTLRELGVNSSILRSGLANTGNIERLKGVMRRALKGKDITLSIVGGSISAGGGLYKDEGNLDGLYYKSVVDWWRKVIRPLTGSDMIVNNIAVGSIGTDYFSYCVKNHIKNESDIVLWELAANDYNRYKMMPTKGARPLERLTRIILELPNKPALLYVNFFKGIDYKNSGSSCPDFEDQGEDVIAHYYKIPSLSWRAMVCDYLVKQDPSFRLAELFSSDEYHPSLKAHAQTALLLLLHLRHVMRAVLEWALEHDGDIVPFENHYVLPVPLFLGPSYPDPNCWTLITPDPLSQVYNSLDVRVVKVDGFKIEYATNFPIRYDRVACWKAENPGAEISLMFRIPETYGPEKSQRLHSEVAVTTHTRWGGSASIWIDQKRNRPLILREGRPNDPGKRTQVDSVDHDVPPGLHTLNIKSLDGGFCLAAIMIDRS